MMMRNIINGIKQNDYVKFDKLLV